MAERAPRSPIIPGTITDRTGAAGIMRRAAAEIRKRWAAALRDVLAAFDRIPVYAVNDVRGADVRYGLTPQQLAGISEELQATLARWIAEGRDLSHVFWWDRYTEESAHLGAAQSAANLTQLSPAYAAARSLEAVIYSEPYRNRIATAKFKSYEHWTGLAAEDRSVLAQLIGQAVADGKNPRAVRKMIAERMDVSKSRALAYAQSDITDTLRQARMSEADEAESALGIKLALLWTSALIPTTRPWHASRSGKTYSSAECRAFYAERGNRYNCFLPGTRVAGRFVAGSKARYKGPTVKLVTASGGDLTVTANHPVMTARGMVSAHEVSEGDRLIRYGVNVEESSRIGDLHDQHGHATIEQVFGALVQSHHLTHGRVLAEDFHGDAAFMEPEIEVVSADRVLSVALDAAGAYLLDQVAFVHAHAPALAGGAQRTLGVIDLAPARGSMGAGSVRAALLRAHFLHADGARVAAPAVLKPGSIEPIGNGLSRDAGALADRQDRLAGNVDGVQARHGGGPLRAGVLPMAEPDSVKCFHQSAAAHPDALGDVVESLAGLAAFDQVVQVIRGEFDGHVFDLEEVSGLMLGNGIVVSNCRCSMTECLIDDAGRPILTKSAQGKLANERKTWQSRYDKG